MILHRRDRYMAMAKTLINRLKAVVPRVQILTIFIEFLFVVSFCCAVNFLFGLLRSITFCHNRRRRRSHIQVRCYMGAEHCEHQNNKSNFFSFGVARCSSLEITFTCTHTHSLHFNFYNKSPFMMNSLLDFRYTIPSYGRHQSIRFIWNRPKIYVSTTRTATMQRRAPLEQTLKISL